MMIMLWAVGIGAALELLLMCLPAVWRIRRAVSVLAVALLGFAMSSLIVWRLDVFSMSIGLLGLYRLLNYLRIFEGRMHEAYLRRAVRRTSLTLLCLQVLAAAGWLAWAKWHINGHTTWAVLGALQVCAGFVFLCASVRRLRRTAWPSRATAMADSQLPTVTVALPARNETEDLEACLASIIASDYPKLEVLVLDDCSQNKRTPEIIRAFAHSGVRFIQGKEPKDTWLAKNQAYDYLAREANGDYLLFCGVDVRFGPDSIRRLVSLALARRKEMVCVLPWHSAPGTAFVQAMRYWWELAPPRRLFNRPPVLSTCWLVQRTFLQRCGGFAAVARSIVPEAFFARAAVRTDAYSFVRATAANGIASVKSAAQQRATAVRMRYPQLRRRPENVALLLVANAVFVLLPFVQAIFGWRLPIGGLAWALGALASVLFMAAYASITFATRTSNFLLALIGLPIGLVYDVLLVHYSMWQYEFSMVEWKGRNVCIPAMHVYPHLPKV